LFLDRPRVHRAVTDEPHRDFLVLMEDVVARGAGPRDAARPLSVDEAACGVRGLARMHGAFWGERITENPALDAVDSQPG